MPIPEAEGTIKMFAPARDNPLVGSFVNAFGEVWNSIPHDHRQTIAEFWHRQCNRYYPRIILEDPWFGGVENLASTEDTGRCLKFDWVTLQLYPQRVMRNPIAHEMAHVYQWSIGKNRL